MPDVGFLFCLLVSVEPWFLFFISLFCSPLSSSPRLIHRRFSSHSKLCAQNFSRFFSPIVHCSYFRLYHAYMQTAHRTQEHTSITSAGTNVYIYILLYTYLQGKGERDRANDKRNASLPLWACGHDVFRKLKVSGIPFSWSLSSSSNTTHNHTHYIAYLLCAHVYNINVHVCALRNLYYNAKIYTDGFYTKYICSFTWRSQFLLFINIFAFSHNLCATLQNWQINVGEIQLGTGEIVYTEHIFYTMDNRSMCCAMYRGRANVLCQFYCCCRDMIWGYNVEDRCDIFPSFSGCRC